MKNITGLLIMISIVIIAGNVLIAQKTNSFRKCATEEVNDSIFNANPEMKKSYLKTMEFVNQYVQAHQGQSPKTTIYIPLVFHVVLSPSQHASFPDSRIHEQVDALNRDFAGLNPHSMGPFPSSLKVNTNIQFYLANVDPNSNPTSGIERRDYTGSFWGTNSGVKFYAQGGLNAWNPYEYLNFWVCDLGGGLCGYAMYPSPAALSSGEFGLVNHYENTGLSGATAPYNNGSTSTHEIAHCFFLKHIWGDQSGCTTDDDCNDTPLQDEECYGVPAGTLYDICTSTGNGIMYMNFMDYVDDAAYANFTPDQMTRMHACFAPGGPLQTLGSQNPPCTANAGNDFSVCGLTATLMPIMNGTETAVNWQSANPSAVFNNPLIPAPTVTVPTPGTYAFIWVVSDQYGSVCFDTVLVTFQGNPPSSFTVSSPVCEGDASLIVLDFPHNPNLVYQWTVNPPGVPAILSGPGPHSVYWNYTGFVTVTLMTTDYANGCTSQITSHIIQVVPSGTPNCCIMPTPNAGNDVTSHCGLTYALNGSVPNQGNTAVWTMVSGVGFATFANANLFNTTVTVSDAGSYVFQWTETNGSCDSSDFVTVTFINQPVANITEEEIWNCGSNAELIAIPSVSSSVLYWSIIPPSSGTFTPNNTSDTVIVNAISGYGTYFIVLNENNFYCSSYDTVQVHFLDTVIPDAGPDQSVCGSYVLLNATNAGQGYWQSIVNAWFDASVWPNDTVLCPSCNQNHSVVARYPSENDTVSYYWIETGNCGIGYDSVNVYFGSYPYPPLNPNSSDTMVCGTTLTTLQIQQPYYGTGYWYDTDPQTQFYPDNTSLHPDSVVISGNAYGMHSFYYVLDNGCIVTSTAVPVKFVQKPNANAGSNYWPGLFGPNSHIKTDTVCGLQYQLSAVPSLGQGLWFTLDPVNTWFSSVGYDSNGSPNPSPMPNDTVNIPFYTVFTSPGYRDFVWIENNDGCHDRDTVRLYFAPAPTPDAGPDQQVCGDYIVLNATQTAGTQGFWSSAYGIWYDASVWPGDTVLCLPCSSYTNVVAFYPIQNLPDGFLWIESNGYCNASDTVNVWPGAGVVQGTISGLGGYTDYTAAVYESGSPVAKGTGTPDAAGLYSVSAPAGTYYLKVNIDNPAAHSNMASTYYSSSWQWSGASTVMIPGCDTTTANITMYTFPLATGGLCRAYGTVMYDNGGPVENADVYLLYKPSNTPAILQKTNASGYYSLNNIPNGNYKIQVDIPGLPQVTTHHITVNQNDTLFPDVNFIVDTINISKDYGWGIYADSNLVYGIGEPLSAKCPMHIYPVPFSNALFMESYNDGNITIEWYNQSGEMLSVEETNVNTGPNSMAIPAKLSRGIYYVKVVTGNTVYVKKLVKE